MNCINVRLALAALLAATFLLPPLAFADSPREELPVVTMKDALGLKLPTVTGLGWRDDSTGLIGSWKEPEASAETLVSWALSSGTRTDLGSGSQASMSPDGRWLVYLDDKRWQLRSLANGMTTPLGGEAPLAPTVLARPSWSRDSRRVAIVDILWPRTPPADPAPETQDGVRVVDVGRMADGPVRDNEPKPRITVIDVARPGKPRSVPITETHVYYGEWGPGEDFYYVAMQGYWKGARAYTALKRVDTRTLRSSEVFRLPGAFQQGAAPRVSPDGRYIALALDIDNRKWDDYVSLVLIDAKSGALRRLTHDYYVAARSYVWAADGESLHFIGRHGGLDQIYRVDLRGQAARITQGERRHYDLGLSPNGAWLSYQTEDGNGRKDIRVRSTTSDEERVVAVLSDPAKDFRLAQFRHVKWKSTDGLEIYGYVFLPPDFVPNRKYPMYVDVHGGGPAARLYLMGPLSAALTSTPLEWHAWAALGYVVFVPDMRSSGEYGPQVAAARYGAKNWDWSGMGKDVEDVEAGTRWMLAQSYVDSRRVAVLGHSAGGGRVNLLLTRSRLFGAGIIHDPIPAGALPSTLSFISGKNAGAGFDETHLSNGIRFADDPRVFTDGFLFDGYKSTTPTLIMVGNPEKGAIDTLSSEVLFSMLRQYGIPTRMLRYVDEGHNPLTAASALHRYREIKAWLDKYIPEQGRVFPTRDTSARSGGEVCVERATGVSSVIEGVSANFPDGRVGVAPGRAFYGEGEAERCTPPIG